MAQGAPTGLNALGPQEMLLYNDESIWTPQIRQHTAFNISQRMLVPMTATSSKFLNSSVSYSTSINPNECADLFSNMYLSTSLPALPSGYFYTPLIGRAIIKKAEFLVDGQVIETLTDDWYIIRDQLFLDADEKLNLYEAINGGQPESNVVPGPVNLMIPLDFFFCRRQSYSKKGREKLEKPFFPICAINQTITIRFTFRDPSWITDAPSDGVDLIEPRILLEEVTITDAERSWYRNTKLNYRINRVWSEAAQPYSNGRAVMNLAADFPVSMIVWFVRNQNYESDQAVYYKSRYTYGYSTDYLPAAIPVTFFNGTKINFLDSIQQATIYLNNKNILSSFPGALYYSYKQPLDHGLAVPTKNLYMYCFGDNPKEYNQEGYVDFSKLDSWTTHLDIVFDPYLAPQIQQSYTMYMYYYGYSTLEIWGGIINYRK